MSRSYKKHPFVKDSSGRRNKGKKREAASKIRNIPIESEDSEVLTQSPSAFRKINHDHWDICDYCYYWSEQQVRKEIDAEDPHYERWLERHYHGVDPLVAALDHWAKCVKRK